MVLSSPLLKCFSGREWTSLYHFFYVITLPWRGNCETTRALKLWNTCMFSVPTVGLTISVCCIVCRLGKALIAVCSGRGNLRREGFLP
jgi:hypothetical protein